jgi:hypothetical protein
MSERRRASPPGTSNSSGNDDQANAPAGKPREYRDGASTVLPEEVRMALHSFSFSTDGGSPFAGLVRDSEGSLYGTTEIGGPGFGTVFKLVP